MNRVVSLPLGVLLFLVLFVAFPAAVFTGAYLGSALRVRRDLAWMPNREGEGTYVNAREEHDHAPAGCVLVDRPNCFDELHPCEYMEVEIACPWGLMPGRYSTHTYGVRP